MTFDIQFHGMFIFLEVKLYFPAGHVARMEQDRSAFKILTGKPTGKRLL